MELYYLDNSGFVLFLAQAAFVFDCWNFPQNAADAVLEKGYLQTDVLSKKQRLYLCISHAHGDHFNPRIFEFANAASQTSVIADADIPVPQGIAHVALRPGECFYDGYACFRAWDSTDIGISLQIEAEGKRIFHAGDLNNWHWREESTEEEVAWASREFTKALDRMAPALSGGLDLAMFPVDPRMGSGIEAGAREFRERFAPAWLVPMHFSNDFARMQEFARTDVDSCHIWAPKQRGDHIIIQTEGRVTR